MNIRIILIGAIFNCLVANSAIAENWMSYGWSGKKAGEIDSQSVRVRDEKVFFTYREPSAQAFGMDKAKPAVVDCKLWKRSEVELFGGFSLIPIWTGFEEQSKLACELAGLPGPNGPLKIGLLYIGPIGDGGWTYSHDRGRRKLEEALGPNVQITWVENVPEGSAARPIIEELVNKGNKLIIGTAFGYLEPMLQVAAKSADVRFEHAMGYKVAPNLRTYEIRTDEGSYLAGIVAGYMTKSNRIGVVAPIPIPEIVRNINAFTLGAQSVNPNIKTSVRWVSEWFNPQKEANAARALIESGADVLLQNTDSSQVLAIAQLLGKRAIGWNSDMSAYGPNAHLGSVVLNWGPYYVKSAKDVLYGSWVSGRVRLGVGEDAVTLDAIANDVPVVAQNRLTEVISQIKERTFSIWNGPIVGSNGQTVTFKGLPLSEKQLEGMYFYVKGVDDKLPILK